MQQEAARLPFTFPADLSTTGSGATDAQGGMTITSDVRVIGLSLASETEGRVASIYGAVLGLTEVDAHAGFQELGGNSLMTAHLLSMIEEEFPGVVDVADLFSWRASSTNRPVALRRRRPRPARPPTRVHSTTCSTRSATAS